MILIYLKGNLLKTTFVNQNRLTEVEAPKFFNIKKKEEKLRKFQNFQTLI